MGDLGKKISTALGGLKIVLTLVLSFRFATLQRLLRVNSLFTEARITGNFSNMRAMFFHLDLPAGSNTPTPLPAAPTPLPEGFDFDGQHQSYEDWKVARSVTAMVVLKDGKITHEDYRHGTGPEDLRISWSMAKSMLSALFGIAVDDGLITDLDDQVCAHVPALKGSAYDGATVRHVLNMSSGVAFNEDYLDFHSDINRMGRVLALEGSMDDFAASLKDRAFKPGTFRRYVSIDTHVLGMVLRAVTGETIADYMTRRLLKPMGLEADPYFLTDGKGVEFVLGGMNMRTRDYARFGLMFAQNGMLNGQQIVPATWAEASTIQSAPDPAPDVLLWDKKLGYGYQWWLPPEATEGEFFAIGIYGQFIYVNRPHGTVVALNGVDRGFKDDEGRPTQQTLAALRRIAEASY